MALRPSHYPHPGSAGASLRRPNLDFRPCIRLCPWRQGTIPPSILAAQGNLKHTGYQRDRLLLSPVHDPAIRHRDPLATWGRGFCNRPLHIERSIDPECVELFMQKKVALEEQIEELRMEFSAHEAAQETTATSYQGPGFARRLARSATEH
jgi:hypothetical protein